MNAEFPRRSASVRIVFATLAEVRTVTLAGFIELLVTESPGAKRVTAQAQSVPTQTAALGLRP